MDIQKEKQQNQKVVENQQQQQADVKQIPTVEISEIKEEQKDSKDQNENVQKVMQDDKLYDIIFDENIIKYLENKYQNSNFKINQTINFKYQDTDSIDKLYPAFQLSETAFTFSNKIRNDFINSLVLKNYNLYDQQLNQNQQLLNLLDNQSDWFKNFGQNLSTKCEKELIDMETQFKFEGSFFSILIDNLQEYIKIQNQNKEEKQSSQQEEEKSLPSIDELKKNEADKNENKQNQNKKDSKEKKKKAISLLKEDLKKKAELEKQTQTENKEEKKEENKEEKNNVQVLSEDQQKQILIDKEEKKKKFKEYLIIQKFDNSVIQILEDMHCYDNQDLQKFRNTFIKTMQNKNLKVYKQLTEQISLYRDRVYFDIQQQTLDMLLEYDYNVFDQLISLKEKNIYKLKLVSKLNFDKQCNQFDNILCTQINEQCEIMKQNTNHFKGKNKNRYKKMYNEYQQECYQEEKIDQGQNILCNFLSSPLNYKQEIENELTYDFFLSLPEVDDQVIENLFSLLFELSDDQDITNSSFSFRREDHYLLISLIHNPNNLERIIEVIAFILNNVNLHLLPIDSFNKPSQYVLNLISNQNNNITLNIQAKCLKFLGQLITKNRSQTYLFLNYSEMGKNKYKMKILNEMADLLKEKHIQSYDLLSCFKNFKNNQQIIESMKQQNSRLFQYQTFNELIQLYLVNFDEQFKNGILKSRYLLQQIAIKDKIINQFNISFNDYILNILSESFFNCFLNSTRIAYLKTQFNKQQSNQYIIIEKILFTNCDDLKPIFKWIENMKLKLNIGQLSNNLKQFTEELKKQISIEKSKNLNLAELDKTTRDQFRSNLYQMIDKCIPKFSTFSEKLFFLMKYFRKIYKWAIQNHIRSHLKLPTNKLMATLQEYELVLKKQFLDLIIDPGSQDNNLFQFYYEMLRTLYFIQEYIGQGISPFTSSHTRYFEPMLTFMNTIKSFLILYNFNLKYYCQSQLDTDDYDEDFILQQLPSLENQRISSTMSIDGQQQKQKSSNGLDQDLPELTIHKHSVSTELHNQPDFKIEDLEQQFLKMYKVIGYLMKYDAKTVVLLSPIILKDNNIQSLPLFIKSYFISNLNVQQIVKSQNRSRSEISLHINRDQFLQSSMQQFLQYKNVDKVLGRLSIQYEGEQGIDQGGLSREWISQIILILMDPQFGLFKHSANNFSMIPNPFSFIIPNHLSYYKFFGYILGKAFQDNFVVNVNFARPFLKLFKQKKLYIQDLEDIDPQFYKNISLILDYNIDTDIDLELNFSYYMHNLGKLYNIQLIENGENIKVCEANKKQYIKEYCKAKLIREIQYQTHAIQQGFYEIVNQEYIELMNEVELGYIFSGAPKIDIQEMKKYMNVNSTYNLQSPQIIWLIEILETFTDLEKSAFLFFISGSMNLPHGGFKNFPINISYVARTDRMPVAHTCSMTIDLPCYQTKEILESRLRMAVFESKGFEIG